MVMKRTGKAQAKYTALINGILILVIATISSLAALYPLDVLEAFELDARAYFFPLIILSVLVSGSFFLQLIWMLAGWLFRKTRNFRELSHSTQATVAVEFMLVIPVLIYFFSTIFSLAEIAHAQLVFRYAAFSAARAGVASDSFLHWPPKIQGGMIYFLTDSDKNRMRAAAVTALAGVDTYAFASNSSRPLAGFDASDLAGIYYAAGQKKPDWTIKKTPWVNKDFFSRQFADADQALASFTAKCEYSKLFTRPPSEMIKDLIREFFVGKLPSGGSGGSWIDKLLADIQRDILNGLLSPLDQLVDLLLKKSGIEDILDKIPNPVSPPMVSVQMEYELRLRAGSLFWMISPNGKNGYPCIVLRRNANSKDNSPLLMQTTGGRIDMPLIPPLIKKVNFMFGDSTF